MLASTNNPEVFPTRHIRPNRLDVLLGFDYPISQKGLESVIEIHYGKSGLQSKIEHILNLQEFKERVFPRVQKFTPSHISKLCHDIATELEFVDISEIQIDGLDEIINSVFDNFIISISDMEKRQSWMKKWREELKIHSSDRGMGFISK